MLSSTAHTHALAQLRGERRFFEKVVVRLSYRIAGQRHTFQPGDEVVLSTRGWHQGDAAQLILFRFEDGVMATHRGVGCTVGHVPAGHNGEWRYEGPRGTLTWEGFAHIHSHQHKVDPKVRRQVELDDTGEGDQNPVLREFVAAISEDREPECSAADNIKSMGMVFAAVQSAKQGREIQIADL